ncbi:hypothetical protein [Chryseobacterium sp. HR92]|uniref:hypothetical protein n=1 Tax=Chryseobacterium sp. HR92 TaxID=3094839 RepID=UPI003890F080|nr:hypothetical protein SFA27_13465 [Chryseobacterium sp. HR92]
MKKIIITGVLSVLTSINIGGQVGINTVQPHASAALEVAGDNKGFLPPRIALKEIRDSITIKDPAAGLLIYNTAVAGNSTNAVVPGYYYWSGNNWTLLSDTQNTWGTYGNSATNPGTNFIGTTDNQDLIFKRGGVIAGKLSGVGIYNTSFGVGSYKGNSGFVGRWNTAIGFESLKGENENMVAHDNTAVGSHSLTSNYNGEGNTGIGYQALMLNRTGKWNVGVGHQSLGSNKTGNYNTALGKGALTHLNDGSENTVIGFLSLGNLPSGRDNVTLGAYAGQSLLMGNSNIIIGKSAARNQSSGSNNIVIGSDIDLKNTSGSNQLNIGNSIYGVNVNAGGNSYASIGINTALPGNALEVKSEQSGASGVRLTNLVNASRLGTNNEGDIIEIQPSVKKITANYTITGADEIILADTSSSSIHLTLPAPSQKGKKIIIKKTDGSANNIVVQSQSQIDAQADISIVQPYSGVVVLDDGTTYWVIGRI